MIRSDLLPETGLRFQNYEGCDYEGFWTGPEKEYLDRLEKAIVAQSLPGGGRVIEIGAGFGRLGGCYVGKYAESHMLEPAGNLREAAAAAYGDSVHFHDGNVYHLPFENESFDAVLMVRVFHHLSDSKAALSEIHRILKPGGRLVFNYSNNRNVLRMAQFLARRASNPFSREIEAYHETLFGHHPEFVERALFATGFRIRRQYSVGIFDKLAGRFPGLLRGQPSVETARLLAPLKLAPAQFIVAFRR